jgi:hypothetical protein
MSSRIDEIEQRPEFAAYSQAIEDAKAAIWGEKVDDPYAAAIYINAIARKCSPHVYVNRLATALTEKSAHGDLLPSGTSTQTSVAEQCGFCAHPSGYFPAELEGDKWIHRGRDNEAQPCTATPRPCADCGELKTSPECMNCQTIGIECIEREARLSAAEAIETRARCRERVVLVRREDAARAAELVNDSIKAKGKFAAAIMMMPPYPAPHCPICEYPIDNQGLCVLDVAHTAPLESHVGSGG